MVKVIVNMSKSDIKFIQEAKELIEEGIKLDNGSLMLIGQITVDGVDL